MYCTFMLKRVVCRKNGLLQIASLSGQAIQKPATLHLTRVSPSSSSSATLDGSPQDLSSSNSSNTRPVAVFPWRHSSSPLPRLIPHSKTYDPVGPCGDFPSDAKMRFFFHVVASRMLNVSWVNIFLNGAQWETNLANTFACAFQTCVGCLFSHVFHVPLQHVAQSTTQNSTDDGSEGAMVCFDSDSPSTHDNSPHDSEDEDQDIVDSTMIGQMMDQQLLDLYEGLSSSYAPPTISVLFKMQVQSAKLENLHVIPILTREMVHRHPAFQGGLQTIIRNGIYRKQMNRNESYMDTVDYMVEQMEDLSRRIVHNARNSVSSSSSSSLKEDADEGIVAFTIVAQVSVMCKERFRVLDVHTGECIQGDVTGKERLVPHLVRFERVVKSNLQTGGKWYTGPWQITDWDDLLDCNIWY